MDFFKPCWFLSSTSWRKVVPVALTSNGLKPIWAVKTPLPAERRENHKGLLAGLTASMVAETMKSVTEASGVQVRMSALLSSLGEMWMWSKPAARNMDFSSEI